MSNHPPPPLTTEEHGDLFEAVTGTTSITEAQLTEARSARKAATAEELELSSYLVASSNADGLADVIDGVTQMAPGR